LTLSNKQVTGTEAPDPVPTYLALPVLLAGYGTYREIVADEIDATFTKRIRSEEGITPVSEIRLMASLPDSLPTWDSNDSIIDLWALHANDNICTYRSDIIAAAKLMPSSGLSP
jgi:hypothetical protein